VRRISFAVMSTLAAVILLFGYRTSTNNPASAATTTVAAGTATTGSAGSSATPAPAAPRSTATAPSAPSASSASAAASTKTVTGAVTQTRWGPVQVRITVAGGQITAVDVLQQPSANGRDVQINSQALPVLKAETITAQSAHIDTVSGATYTSNGYTTSLQSALDQAAL
jgi:uncharacterized protein with FMN-binding domain